MDINYLREFQMEDSTEDYDSDFHYTFTVGTGKDDSGIDRKIYAAMSGYVHDGEADDFRAVVYSDDDWHSYYLDDQGLSQILDKMPPEVVDKLKELSTKAIYETESEKMRQCASYWRYVDISLENCENGIISFDIGEFKGTPIYADFYAEIVEDNSILPNHDKGQHYLAPVYNIHNDKAYVIVPNEAIPNRAIYFDMPKDILEYCKKQAAKEAESVYKKETQKEDLLMED